MSFFKKMYRTPNASLAGIKYGVPRNQVWCPPKSKMTVHICKQCGLGRSDRTTPCPNCGTIATHTHLGPLLKTLVVASVLFVALLCLIYVDVDTSSPTSSSPRRGGGQYVRLRQALAYLSEIEEVQWYECEDNNVYVGFEPIPNDWQMIVKGAAVRGNEAIEFGCHVWAVPANKHGWRPGDSSFLGEATARHSRISDTSWDD